MKKLLMALFVIIILQGCSEIKSIKKNEELKSEETELEAPAGSLPYKEPASKSGTIPSSHPKQPTTGVNEETAEIPVIEKALKELENDQKTLIEVNKLDEKPKETEYSDKEMNQEVLHIEELDEQLAELDEISSELDELEILERELEELEILLKSLEE